MKAYASVVFCAPVIVANRPPVKLERQLTLDSVNVSDCVIINISDSDDDSATYTDYRHSLHQFADVLYTMPMPFWGKTLTFYSSFTNESTGGFVFAWVGLCPLIDPIHWPVHRSNVFRCIASRPRPPDHTCPLMLAYQSTFVIIHLRFIIGHSFFINHKSISFF